MNPNGDAGYSPELDRLLKDLQAGNLIEFDLLDDNEKEAATVLVSCNLAKYTFNTEDFLCITLHSPSILKRILTFGIVT